MRTALVALGIILSSSIAAAADESFCQQLQQIGFRGRRVIAHAADGAQGASLDGVIAEFRPGVMVIEIGEESKALKPLYDEQGKIIEPAPPRRIYINCSLISSVELHDKTP